MVTETAGGSGEESRLRRGGEAHPWTAAARAAAAPGRTAPTGARLFAMAGKLRLRAAGPQRWLGGAARRGRSMKEAQGTGGGGGAAAAGHGSSGAPPVRPLRQMEREKAGG